MLKDLKHQSNVTSLRKWSDIEVKLHEKLFETREAVHEALCGRFFGNWVRNLIRIYVIVASSL
jgi:hypothetical protein